MRSLNIIGLLALFVVTQTFSQGYHLLRKNMIGGEGGWDYLHLDAKTRTLYIAHSTQVEVFNVDTWTKGDPITNLQGVHGVAIDSKRKHGYISNGRSNVITVFDLDTHKIVVEIPSTGQNPDAIIFDAYSDRIFAFNGRSKNATAIDAGSGKVAGTIDIGGKPEFAVSDGKGTIYVNDEDQSRIVSFDAKSLALKKQWSIAPGEGPSGLAIDKQNKRLFSVCDKIMVVSDYENGQVVTTVPIGNGPDAVRFDPETKLIFSSNGEGTLTVIKQESADKYAVLENVATARGARTLELDAKTHHVFVVTAEFGPAAVATKEQPRPRPPVLSGSFMLLEFGK